jgi:hypothetical protein
MKRHVASKHRIQSRRDLHAPQLLKIYGTKYKTLYARSSKMSVACLQLRYQELS